MNKKCKVDWIIKNINDCMSVVINYGTKNEHSEFVPVGYYTPISIVDCEGRFITAVDSDDDAIEKFLMESYVYFEDGLSETDYIMIPLSKLYDMYEVAEDNSREPADNIDSVKVTKEAIRSLSKHEDSEYLFSSVSLTDNLTESNYINGGFNYSLVPFKKVSMSNRLKKVLLSAALISDSKVSSLAKTVASCTICRKSRTKK